MHLAQWGKRAEKMRGCEHFGNAGDPDPQVGCVWVKTRVRVSQTVRPSRSGGHRS